MEAQKIAVDAVVALTDCDRDAVIAFIRRLYLAGVTFFLEVNTTFPLWM